MKKSIFSFAVIAIAAMSTVVLSSCDKNDDGYGQSAKPQTTVQTTTNTSASSSTNSSTTTPSVSPTMASTAKLSLNAFAISEELAQLGTWTVTITDGSKTAEYDIVAQGKIDSYLTNNDERFTGYVLAISQPYSESIKTTVKFIPNDKAKSMTKDTSFDGTFGVCHTEVTDPSAEVKFVAVGIKKYAGNHAIDACETIASFMSK